MPYQIKSETLRDLFVCRRGDEEIPVYPLTLGVTGHRRVAPTAVDVARAQTRDLLTRLAEYWRGEQGAKEGETSPAPFVVFNGLAAGADSLVAEEVLRLKAKRPELDARLVAVLPAPRAIYEQDFAQGEELEQFQRLVASADDVVELKLTEENRRWLEENPDAQLPWELRKAQYEALGRSLAESSLYVLALWDGVEARLENGEVVDDDRGGTADVVRMKTIAFPAPYGENVRSEALSHFQKHRETQPFGAVFHIATPRDGAASTFDSGLKPGQCFVCVREETSGAEEARLRRWPIDDFDAFFETRRAGTLVKSALRRSEAAIRIYADLLTRTLSATLRRTQNASAVAAPTKSRKSVAARFKAFKEATEKAYFQTLLEPFDRLRAEGRAASEVKKPLKETARFNRDVVDGYESQEARRARRESVAYLLGDDYAAVDDETKFLVERYAVADSASLAFQKKFFGLASVYIFILAFFNVVICKWELFFGASKIFEASEIVRKALVGAYYASLIVVFWMFLRQNRWAYYERYHRYRALAEALRVQIFWRVAGIADAVGDAYWTHQIKELNWLRFTAKGATAAIGAPGQGDYNVALVRWARVQREYLEDRVRAYECKERVLGSLGCFFAAVFLLVLLMRFASDILLFASDFTRSAEFISIATERLYRWSVMLQNNSAVISVLGSASSFIAVCCFTWNRLRAYGSQRKRYVKSLPIYRRVEKKLAELNAASLAIGADVEALDGERQKWLRDLGEIALSENADWFLAKRRLELPK